MFNFNSVMGLENETNPTEAANTTEVSTFDKVVTTAAKVGVIAGATVLTIAAVNSIVSEVAIGAKATKTGFTAAKNHIAAKKADKKAAEIEAFKQSLIDKGMSDDKIKAMVKAEYGIDD